jgi:hypothetical protein
MSTLIRNAVGVAIGAILVVSAALLTSRNVVADSSKDVIVGPLPLPVVVNGNSSTAGLWIRSVNDAVEPVQARANLIVPPGSHGQGLVLYNVPAGKRLVIEYGNAFCTLPAGQAITLEFETGLNGSSAIHHLQSSPPAPFGSNPSTAASQAVRLYADPGTQLTSFVVRTDTSGTASCVVQLSGYLAALL